AVCKWARWSPDNHRIACVTQTSIVILDSEGSNTHTVASFQSIPSNLIWSPNGHRLRFLLRDRASTPSAWQLTFGTENGQEVSTLTKLQNGKDVCWDWTWTLKGDRFACLRPDSEGKSSLLLESSDDRKSGSPAQEAE